MMKEQQVESKADDDTAAASARAAFLEVVKKKRARALESLAKTKKEFSGDKMKAAIEKGRIKIKEYQARMELRKRERERDAEATSASPPKPSLDLSNKLPKSSSPAANEDVKDKHISPAANENVKDKHISPAANENVKDKHISDDQIIPVLLQHPRPGQHVCGILVKRKVSVYDFRDPKDTTLTPQDRFHIRKDCILALEKYNNEKGTNYRYVRLLRAHEVREPGTFREAILTVTFTATDSDSDSDSKTFIAKITSGLRIFKKDLRFGKEIKQVYQVTGYRFD